jgi:hypothetical protein
MADPILTSELLEKYSNEKFGYGNPGVSEYPTVWFLGPEEKGSYEELQERVQAWFSAANSNESFVDIEIFHKQLDLIQSKTFADYYFGPNNVTQRTWKGIIEILFGFEDNPLPDLNIKKKYQRESFGRLYSDNCIIELSPFQSEALTDCNFDNKDVVMKATLPNRIKKVGQLIVKHRPKVVFMHTKAYWPNFEKVIAEAEGLVNFEREKIQEAGNFRYYQGYFSFYALIPAPSFAIKGGPGTWFNLGKEIKRLAIVGEPLNSSEKAIN